MAFIRSKCPQCDKPAEILLETEIPGDRESILCNDCVAEYKQFERIEQVPSTTCEKCTKKFAVWRYKHPIKKAAVVLKCGHVILKEKIDVSEVTGEGDPLDSIQSLDKKKLYEYQKAGIKACEASGIRFLFADEMGIGKTIQFLIVMKQHPEACPFILCCKSGLKTQMAREIIRWCGPEYVPQVIESSRESFLPGFKSYIMSIDMLDRFSNHGQPKKKGKSKGEMAYAYTAGFMTPEDLKKEETPNRLVEQIKAVGIKTLILDECQTIKNTVSKRTVAVRKVVQEIPYFIGASGTPIKNNAAEYFSVLNMLRPDMFWNEAAYIRRYCQINGMKVGGLKDPKRFLEETKGFIIRRERAEVLPDLPAVTRNFQFNELGPEVEAAYIATLKDFQKFEEEGSQGMGMFEKASHTLAYLSKMRHLTGLSKIDPTADFVLDFLAGTERKIVVFTHHIDVAIRLLHGLMMRLENDLKEHGWDKTILHLPGGLPADHKQGIIDAFKAPEFRVMVASTLASGEGLNLQFCSDCVMMERQWNPANEEQAEGRFIRVGQLADKVTATYMVAVGTIDEFFAELVEKKREIVVSTMKGEAIKWDEQEIIQELKNLLMQKGGKKWGF